MVIEEELRHDLPLVQIDAEQLIQVILNIAYNPLNHAGGGTLVSDVENSG